MSFGLTLKASMHQGRSEFEDVVDLAQKAIALNSRNEMAYLMLGDCYSRLGKYDDAIQIFKKSLRYFPPNHEANYYLATAIIKSKRPIIEALPYLKAFLELLPKEEGKFPFFMNWFAKVFRKNIDFDSYGKQLDANLLFRKEWAERVINDIKTNT